MRTPKTQFLPSAVGVPLPGLCTLTVAVKVTVCPKTDGLIDGKTEVVVAAVCTTG